MKNVKKILFLSIFVLIISGQLMRAMDPSSISDTASGSNKTYYGSTQQTDQSSFLGVEDRAKKLEEIIFKIKKDKEDTFEEYSLKPSVALLSRIAYNLLDDNDDTETKPIILLQNIDNKTMPLLIDIMKKIRMLEEKNSNITEQEIVNVLVREIKDHQPEYRLEELVSLVSAANLADIRPTRKEDETGLDTISQAIIPLIAQKIINLATTIPNFSLPVFPTLNRDSNYFIAQAMLPLVLPLVQEKFIITEEPITLTDHEYPHRGAVWSAQFSPDGKYVVTASNDHTAKVWHVMTGKLLYTLSHEKNVGSAQFSSDGKYIVTASYDHTAKIWRAPDNTVQGGSTSENLLLNTFTDSTEVYRARFSTDGKYIVTALGNGSAKVWQAPSGLALDGQAQANVSLYSLEGYQHYLSNAQFSPDDKYIIATSVDNTAKIWLAPKSLSEGENTPENLLFRNLTVPGVDFVHKAQFSPDSNYIVLASGKLFSTYNPVTVWSVQTGDMVNAPLIGHTKSVDSAQFSHDGKYIVTASKDRTAKVWLAPSNRNQGDNTPENLLLGTLEGHKNIVLGAQFSPDNKYIVTASYDKTAKVWRAPSNSDEGENTPENLLLGTLDGHKDSVNSAQFSPDSSRIVTASNDKTAKIWRIKINWDEVNSYWNKHVFMQHVVDLITKTNGKNTEEQLQIFRQWYRAFFPTYHYNH